MVDFFVNLHLNPGPERITVCSVFQRWHEVNLNATFIAHGNLQCFVIYRNKFSAVYVSQ